VKSQKAQKKLGTPWFEKQAFEERWFSWLVHGV